MAELSRSPQAQRDLVKAYLSTPESCFGDTELEPKQGRSELFSSMIGKRKIPTADREYFVGVYESENGAYCLDLQFAIRSGNHASIFQMDVAPHLCKEDVVGKIDNVLDRVMRIHNAFNGALDLPEYTGVLALAVRAELGVAKNLSILSSNRIVPTSLRSYNKD